MESENAIYAKYGPLRVLETAKGFELCDRYGLVIDVFTDEMKAGYAEAFSNLTGIRELATNLVKRLEEVEPAITSAFQMAYTHGSEYHGPSYGLELEALRRHL